MKKPTRNDVADLAGVSSATVSQSISIILNLYLLTGEEAVFEGIGKLSAILLTNLQVRCGETGLELLHSLIFVKRGMKDYSWERLSCI